MVSLACEQWPDTVIPVTEELEPAKNEPTVLTVEPKHLFDAWEQSCLELAAITGLVIHVLDIVGANLVVYKLYTSDKCFQ